MNDLIPSQGTTETNNNHRSFYGVDLDELRGRIQRKAQEDPEKAVATAFGIGFVLSLLPLTTLVRLLIRLVMFSIKPALLIFGAMKLYDIQQRETR